jgi:heat shock protein HtpX
MISALRKIEGRGELPGTTSAVMEMCIDNPRQGFGELFDTHPSVDSRVAALVKFAGGHDPGPLALPPQASDADDDRSEPPPPRGPWGPAVDESSEGQDASPDPSSDSSAGPWGPHTGATSQSGHN